jgi:hypothetical protein
MAGKQQRSLSTMRTRSQANGEGEQSPASPTAGGGGSAAGVRTRRRSLPAEAAGISGEAARKAGSAEKRPNRSPNKAAQPTGLFGLLPEEARARRRPPGAWGNRGHAPRARRGRGAGRSRARALCSRRRPPRRPQVTDFILKKCTTQQLGMLETTCTFFSKSGITDRVALGHLRAIPRAKGLRPNKKCGAAGVNRRRRRAARRGPRHRRRPDVMLGPYCRRLAMWVVSGRRPERG